MIFRSNLARNTISMLPRSMTVVFQILTRSLVAHYQRFWIYHPDTVVWVNLINSLPLCLNGLILGALSCSAFPWESYTLILGYKHIFLSIGLINPIISFSFPLACLIFLWSIWYKQNNSLLIKHPDVQPCQWDPVTNVADISVSPMDENFAYWSASN